MPLTSRNHSVKLIAFLTALSLFLSAIEYAIPKPVPFMRLGLANLSILIGLELLSPGNVIVLVLFKALGQGLIQGTLFSYIFLFSLAGSLASGVIMILTKLVLGSRVTLIGISVLGALASNSVQIILARFIIFGESAWLIAPAFFLIGTISSATLGAISEVFYRRSQWVKLVISEGRISTEED
ncbi:MAG: Gx transporter family protein [Spirochaetales bacterium]|nr:Gx transporter family protein [Spirochaetales bacterium]